MHDVLVCKRQYHDLDPWQAELTDSQLVACQDCQIPVYAMRKNLGRGLILLCAPCVAKRLAKENEPVVFIPGESIGSEYEADVRKTALEFEQYLKQLTK